MNILLVTAQPFTPQMTGGLQTSANELNLRLKERGHNVSLLCALMPKGFWGIRGRILIKLSRIKAAKDNILGYPVWRAWFPCDALANVIKSFEPDIIIVLARQPVRMALEAKKLGIPILMMLQDVEFSDHGGDFSALGKVECIANSRFTAEKYKTTFGVDPVVIHPIIDGKKKYKTTSSQENVTFINPHAFKGVDIAIAVAKQCPEIPFSFIEAWPLKDNERHTLRQAIINVPNIRLFASTSDMRNIYSKCKILLVPSRWEEAYGRVASEAQFSGIPVVASNRGGLPEAVGEGGILLDPDGSIDLWVKAVRSLWHDRVYYTQLSNAALRHSESDALKWETQIILWEKAIKVAIAAASKS